jgi:predicted dehydrogenase
MSKIRVGLIRCDTHGMWFGPQMMRHDPKLLEHSTDDPELLQYETWLRRGVHYFFYTHYSAPDRMTAPFVEGFEITRIWDWKRKAAEAASKVFFGKPKVCDSFAEVSDDVDLVFVANCNGDGSDNLQLATPGLEKGIPTFVDKPFANNSVNAKKLLDLAVKRKTPLLSLSILQTNPATARFRNRLPEVGKLSFGTITCYSTHPAALIHAISIAHHVFGTGIQTVRAVVAPKHTTFHLDYGDRDDRPAHGVLINCGTAYFRFTEMFACAYGPEGAIQGQCLDDFDASDGSAKILEHCRDMVLTGKVTPLFDEMVEAIAVMDACKLAESTGQAAKVQP